jgi:hypothetical protein
MKKKEDEIFDYYQHNGDEEEQLPAPKPLN